MPTTPKTLEAASEEVLGAWLRAAPVTASALGDHASDARWRDVTSDGLMRDRQRIDAAVAILDDVARGQLDVEETIDLAVLRNAIERQMFEHEVERPWRVDPLWYAQHVGTGLESLVMRDYAPLPERAVSLAARLASLPAFLEQAAANLDPLQAYAPQADVAIAQFEGVVDLIRQTVPVHLASAPDELRAQVGGAGAGAVGAIRAFQQHLRDAVIPVAAGNWRLGPENYDRKLSLTLMTDLNGDRLRDLATREQARVRAQMATLARELGEVLLSRRQRKRLERNSGSDADADAAIIRAVLAELAANHVEPAALRDAIEANIARLLEFVRAKDIIALDDAEVLNVIWTPSHQRGVFIAGLDPPGPLEPTAAGLPSFYLVQPVPPEWSSDTKESFLREYNDFMLEVLSIHEAIPGHFVQLYYGKREPSKIRRVLQSGTFVEGWAVYSERVMVELGYSGSGPAPGARRPSNTERGLWTVMTTPALRAKAIELHRLKFYLRTVTNALLDHGVHAMGMTRPEALELMIGGAFQEEGEAIGKWTRAQVTSTQLSTYFVGAQAWFRLRERAQARANAAGEALDLAAFHGAALSHGAPPPHVLPQLLGWNAPASDGAARRSPAAASESDDVPEAERGPTPEQARPPPPPPPPPPPSSLMLPPSNPS